MRRRDTSLTEWKAQEQQKRMKKFEKLLKVDELGLDDFRFE